MIHVDWHITAAVICFYLGLFLIYLWTRIPKPPKDMMLYVRCAYECNKEKMRRTKWYQVCLRHKIRRNMKREIKKAEDMHRNWRG